MNEERFLILKMVEEGKITAEEAAALLDALERESEMDKTAELGEEEGQDKDFPRAEEKEAKDKRSAWERLRDAFEQREDEELELVLEEEARRFAKNVEAAAVKLSRMIEERIEKEVKPALANLPSLLARIPVIGEYVGELVTEERQGTFLPGTVGLDLSAADGSIEVRGWPQEYYHLVLRVKVWGGNKEAARERVAEIAEVEESGSCLRVISRAGVNEAVHIKLSVPENRLYDLSVSTSNGQVKIASLKDAMGSVVTSNGRVAIKDLKGTRLAARTSNGAIECDNINLQELILTTSDGPITVDGFAQRLEARTSNGSIEVIPRLGRVFGEQSLDLHTSKSGIRVKLPPALASACWLDLSSGFHSIDVDLDDLLYHIREESVGSKRIQAETKGYATADARIRVVARSMHGGLNVEKA